LSGPQPLCGCPVAEENEHADPEERKAPEVLHLLVECFEKKGWLGRKIRIRYRGLPYLLLCTRDRFFAYRLNDDTRASSGVPGWPVCVVDCDETFDDSEIGVSPSTEPDGNQWLLCVTNEDLEVV
jgi:hypothetical protein